MKRLVSWPSYRFTLYAHKRNSRKADAPLSFADFDSVNILRERVNAAQISGRKFSQFFRSARTPFFFELTI